MRISPTQKSNRTVNVAGEHEGRPFGFELTLGYTEDDQGRATKAVALDGAVIPEITKAVNILDNLKANIANLYVLAAFAGSDLSAPSEVSKAALWLQQLTQEVICRRPR